MSIPVVVGVVLFALLWIGPGAVCLICIAGAVLDAQVAYRSENRARALFSLALGFNLLNWMAWWYTEVSIQLIVAGLSRRHASESVAASWYISSASQHGFLLVGICLSLVTSYLAWSGKNEAFVASVSLGVLIWFGILAMGFLMAAGLVVPTL